ncbi:MAG: Mur ligase family protein [Acidobacteriota bacterium]
MSGTPRDLYFIAIGGTGMAPLACLLQEQGHRVRGSDGPLYPPMSTLLENAGITPHVGWDPAHLHPAPDLVVVGNAVPRSNPEAEEMERRGLPRLSMPEALGQFFLVERRPLVVAGTHGKTTTTSLAAWVYTACGGDPGYLIGGVPIGLPGSFQVGAGERFVVEGDEYNAAYFDRGAKFLHYRPETAILTSVEYDHADLYPDFDSLRDAYGRLLELVPDTGRAILCGDSEEVRRLAPRSGGEVVFYGIGENNDVRLEGAIEAAAGGGTRFRVRDEAGVYEVSFPMTGTHNVENALAVWAAARGDGYSPEQVAAALAGFRGIQRRQQEIGTAGGVTVVDDFAHHPTAVERTLEGLRARYGDRPLTVLYEPRSLTAARSFLLDAYRRAFRTADRVLIAPTFHAGRLAPEERIDFSALSAELSAPGEAAARAFDSMDDLLEAALDGARAGDVLVTMSSGSFDGMPRRLLEGLRAQPVGPAG